MGRPGPSKIKIMRRKHKTIDGIRCNSDKRFRKKKTANKDAERLRRRYKKLSDKHYYIVRVLPDKKHYRVWWMYGRKDRGVKS